MKTIENEVKKKFLRNRNIPRDILHVTGSSACSVLTACHHLPPIPLLPTNSYSSLPLFYLMMIIWTFRQKELVKSMALLGLSENNSLCSTYYPRGNSLGKLSIVHCAANSSLVYLHHRDESVTKLKSLTFSFSKVWNVKTLVATYAATAISDVTFPKEQKTYGYLHLNTFTTIFPKNHIDKCLWQLLWQWKDSKPHAMSPICWTDALNIGNKDVDHN